MPRAAAFSWRADSLPRGKMAEAIMTMTDGPLLESAGVRPRPISTWTPMNDVPVER